MTFKAGKKRSGQGKGSHFHQTSRLAAPNQTIGRNLFRIPLAGGTGGMNP
jgi:hypothetical protein